METTQKEDLQQRLNSLLTQPGEFIKWYLEHLIYKGRIFGNRWDGLGVYLPYSGKDQEVILRLFKGFARIVYPGFILDDSNMNVIKHLIQILACDDNKRGLIIRGEVGVGKTTLVLIWHDFRRRILSYGSQKDRDIYHNERIIKVLVHSPTCLISNFLKEEHSFIEKAAGSDVLIIDDMGIPTTVNHYGTVTNILEQLIYSRYTAFKENPYFEFYGTTNCQSKELQEVIGERALSRLSEMASWTEGLLPGTDRRKSESILNKWPEFKSQSNNQHSGPLLPPI